MIARNLFLIAFGVQFTHPRTSGQAVETIAFEDAIDTSIRNSDAVTTRQVPDNPNWSKVILVQQIQNLLDDLRWRLIGWILRNWLGILQTNFTCF